MADDDYVSTNDESGEIMLLSLTNTTRPIWSQGEPLPGTREYYLNRALTQQALLISRLQDRVEKLEKIVGGLDPLVLERIERELKRRNGE